MPARNPFLEFVQEQFSPLGEISSRAMFGGYCLYCNGIVFALVANNQVYLKADQINRPQFEARRLPPFRPFEDQNTVMSYYQAPPEIYEDSDAMRQWCGGAAEAGKRAQIKKKGSRTTAKS